ncbi:hypothetical protein [Psychroserpens sp.]|uniref:hypothetical protein n=1 Tax=Psychroserpens sp. TaxID=2020870 RepID=UPI001AFFBCEC|nr:hypothetical protein [Psychroserpens sp.]MBO6605439.1 hypothetical protein [Psychroserpens sp.]MBO6630077.1 hypothetical protein [Psychroserpens sp.]MBO6653752.1 hypothetical protein [Psychroserpens sp.]MBO6682073.1 hypothetical protein [Psychroserpens sp.]MBO6748813.1 hypothetical protein [Psychroserpens sp.]
MSEKKHIDKLFKEQLKDFEVAPGDYVWERIEGELHKDKRKRRVIPIWWKIAGVAAALAVLFTVGKSFFSTSDANSTIETEVVDTNESNSSEEQTTNRVNSETKSNSETNTELVDTPNNDAQLRDDTNNTPDINSADATKNEAIAENNKDALRDESKSNPQNNKDRFQTTVTSTKSNHVKNKSERVPSPEKGKAAVAENKSKPLKSEEDILKPVKERDAIIKEVSNPTQTQVTDASSTEKDLTKVAIDSSKTIDTTEKVNAIEEAIAQAEDIEKENEDKDDTPSKRWSVAPNVAPVYFNTLGEGSPIDDQFIGNTKEGEINVSYGIRGSYAINDKLKIRAGVNRVDLGYSTRNVIEFSRPTASIAASSQLKNVKLHDNSSTFISANSISLSTAPDILFIKEQGSIDQQLGFIEVPVELEYSLVDKKFGFNLIGGFSTLFLNNNEIYSVQNNGVRTLLGEATNINNMSYSANFGVGFNYSLSQQLRFNLEPMFKYQINTFNDTSGDFQPFFIGVYTGLSFKF